jgi:hypothetical protein
LVYFFCRRNRYSIEILYVGLSRSGVEAAGVEPLTIRVGRKTEPPNQLDRILMVVNPDITGLVPSTGQQKVEEYRVIFNKFSRIAQG